MDRGKHSVTTRLLDAAVWLVAFYLIGAPLLPANNVADVNSATGAPATTDPLWRWAPLHTISFALLVSFLWPCSVLQWCALLAKEDAWTVRHEQAKPRQSSPHREQGREGDVVSAPTSPPLLDSDGARRDLWEGCVLSLAILLGGLGPQLDWQLRLQMWPVPSLLLFLLARGACVLARRCRRRRQTHEGEGEKADVRKQR